MTAAERFALPALGRAAGRRPTGKMLRRRKLLEIAAESPASGARFVGWRFILEPLYSFTPNKLFTISSVILSRSVLSLIKETNCTASNICWRFRRLR